MVAAYFRNRHLADLGASALAVAIFIFAMSHPGRIFDRLSGNDVHTFSLAVFGAAVSLTGFVIASGTFLISHAQNDAFKILRQSRSYRQLPEIIAASIWRLFGLVFVSVFLAISAKQVQDYALGMMVFCLSYAALGLLSLTYIVIKMLSIPLSSNG